MESLVIEKTPRTPKVNFDTLTGIFEMAGRSIPENAPAFYNPILDWLEQCKQKSNISSIQAVFKLEYFNTASSKLILDVFKKLETFKEKGKLVSVQWYYDPKDEDMQDAGKDFKDIIALPFELFQM